MGKYFGTDGFRGEANESLTAERAFLIGRFLGWYLTKKKELEGKTGARVVIGKDARLSGYMLEYALVGGLVASGADAYLLHVTTTPSVSYIVRAEGFDCGVMISASHNPYYDNGIKLFNEQGEKLDDGTTELIENYLDGRLFAFGNAWTDLPYARRENIGKIYDHVAGRNRYVGYLISLGRHSFRGYKVGLDCANGSAWTIAKTVFDALGATTVLIGGEPNGLNINDGVGSTHIEALQRLVKEKSLDVGFAFDGDADRCLCVDENGKAVDGDKILYICARYLKERGELAEDTVVTTVMSNLGLYKSLEAVGLRYAKTSVGDRFVYEYMTEHGCSLGGEQSGHIIFSKYARTGDGILTALKIMEILLEKKIPISALAASIQVYPQVLRNVAVVDKTAALSDKEVFEAAESARERLGEDGRLLLRKSGTESVVRVMAEAADESLCKACVDMVADILQRKFGQ